MTAKEIKETLKEEGWGSKSISNIIRDIKVWYGKVPNLTYREVITISNSYVDANPRLCGPK